LSSLFVTISFVGDCSCFSKFDGGLSCQGNAGYVAQCITVKECASEYVCVCVCVHGSQFII